jgi:hypothetical protein
MKIILIISFLISSLLLIGQTEPVQKEITQNNHFWVSINSTTRLNNRWGVMGDFHIRREHFIKDPNFYFLRFGAVYWASDNLTIAGGLAHLWLASEYDDGFHFAGEKRIYQQVQWRDNLGKSFFLFRIRNEQRWHEVLDSNAEVDRVRFSNRLRFLFSTTFRFFDDPYLPKLVIADEVHIHFGKEIVFNTFDQNRIFVGISQRLSKTVSFDLGYMLVYQQKYSGYQYDMNHTFRWFFYYTPDFRKDKKEGLDHYPMSGDE